MEIHNRLKDARKKAMLTQNEVCEKMGISEMQLRRWEKGQSEMGIYKFKEICILYGVSADYILGIEKAGD